jgi:hypothetical protein
MTQLSDDNAFYGRYVSKKEKAVPLSVSREIERSYMEESTKCRIALGDIERAHSDLDALGVSRHQKNTPQFSLSLSGRIRSMKNANQSFEPTGKAPAAQLNRYRAREI